MMKKNRKTAQEDPALFLSENPYPLLIDEAQYAPQLFSYIKMKVDEVGDEGMYWLTGSQQFALMRNARESLAGRIGIVPLNSLTYSEIIDDVDGKLLFNPKDIKKYREDILDVNELYRTIFRGGMPELYDNENKNREQFFNAYLNTYLMRDVEGVLDVKDLELFRKFMSILAIRNGEVLNYSNIANEARVSDKTVRTWVDVLVTCGIVYLLQPYFSTKLGQLTHAPKVYFMDQGLCAFLAGEESARSMQLSSRSEHYLEAFVISEILKSYHAAGLDIELNYYRDKRQNEIDLILNDADNLYPFEIKKTITPDKSMIANFALLEGNGSKKVSTGGVICFCDRKMRMTETNYMLPIGTVINPHKA